MKHTIPIKTLCAAAMLSLGIFNAHAQGVINTIAGNGLPGFSGDGGPAISANLFDPSGVAVDAAGNLIIADRSNARLRKVDAATGIITTVVGSGSWGYSGMGGPALSAGLEYPNALFIDAAGNYLATDFYADCAYRIDPSGIISNICGHGWQGCTGDGGPGSLATMELPNGICEDGAGNIYIADYGNNRVRKLDPSGIVTTFAGNGTYGYSPDGTPAVTCSFQQVTGIAVTTAGRVFISDGGNNIVRTIDADGTIRTVAGFQGLPGNSGDGFGALNARLNRPAGLYVNSIGNLFICDLNNNNVRVYNIASGMIQTLAGNGIIGFAGDGGFATSAELNQPTGVWEDASGVIYIADGGNNRIRTVVGSGYRGISTGVGTVAANSASIYPNPSTGTFTIQAGSIAPDMSVAVYNVMGQKVYGQSITQLQTNVSLDQPSGVYQVIFKSAGNTTTQKIVLEK